MDCNEILQSITVFSCSIHQKLQSTEAEITEC